MDIRLNAFVNFTHDMLRNYNNYKPYLFPSFRCIHLKRQYFNHGFDSPPLHLPLNDLLKESKVPTITEILKLFYVNLLIIFLLVTISLSWLRKSRAHNVNLCFKCILSGEGKRRNEFAEWHVAWLAE